MSCYGWADVVDDGYGLGMGTNSKEMLALVTTLLGLDPFKTRVDDRLQSNLVSTALVYTTPSIL
jgi:hypothetical protein